MLKTTLTTFVFSALFAGPTLAQTIFINDGRVVTNTTGGTLDKGDVLIIDGRISDIGPELAPPAGAEIIDATDKWVTPGLFSPFSQLGLVEIGAEASTNDSRASEADTSVSDRGADSFNPKSPVIGITRASGITHAAISPTAGHNIFGGLGFVASTTGEFDSIKDEISFVFVQLGERGSNLAGGSRSASMSQLRAALDDAMAYPARYDGPEEGDTLPRRDAAALAPAARGRMPLVIAADRAVDMLNIIDLKNDYGGLDVIILGAAEAWMIADELEDNFIRVMVDPLENLPGSFDSVGARLDNVAFLKEADVEFAIMSRSSSLTHNLRLLNQHAGNAVAQGLDWDEAFQAISSTPAAWFNTRSGTLVQGQTATVVVWDGDPLELTSAPVHMMIDGVVQSLDSRQKALRDRYNPTSTETRPHKYR